MALKQKPGWQFRETGYFEGSVRIKLKPHWLWVSQFENQFGYVGKSRIGWNATIHGKFGWFLFGENARRWVETTDAFHKTAI